jgi:branched-chain amino acid transport system ATP-binding protein
MTHAGPGDGRPVLRVEDVSVRRNIGWPLRDITIDVAAGEAVAILGPRGCGKSALLDVISGFLRPDRGRVMVTGTDVTRWAPHRIARAGIARSFQSASAFDAAAVRDAVFPAAVGRGLGARETREAMEEALAITGLDTVEDHPAASLGAVGQRLVCLARVAAAAPRLALLDEPLAGLAPGGAGRIVSVLRGLQAAGVALLVTGHDPASLRVVCSRAVLLRDGRIAGGGRPADMHRA